LGRIVPGHAFRLVLAVWGCKAEIGGSPAGHVVPGVYETLLGFERERNERDDRLAAQMMAKDGFCNRRGRFLAERLEAGAAVVVRCAHLTLALWERDRERDPSALRVRLPFERGVWFVRVSHNDRVVPGGI
jgi:hypothetical protein